MSICRIKYPEIIWKEANTMCRAILWKDHINTISRKERLYNKPTKFKRMANKILFVIGLRWL